MKSSSRCAWCGGALVPSQGPGRPRRFCGQPCRQRAYEARAHAKRLGLDDSSMVVSREWYVAVQDRRYELELALDDVRRWRRGDRSERSVEETLAWLESHVEALLDIGRS